LKRGASDDASFNRRSTSERVGQLIRERLAAGALRPGDRIVEVDIAQMLGVSRSPVREALSRLEFEGVLVSQPNRGRYVAPLASERLQQVVDFRLALEELAVRSFARYAGEGDFLQLLAAVRTLRARAASKEFNSAVQADLTFHRLIVALARNAPLKSAYEGLLSEFQLSIRLTTQLNGSLEDLAVEHERLIEALRQRRTEEAVALMRSHILHGHERLLAELSEVSSGS
jgi:DNA-binding GntR family transcriptional regulator